jgi:hypothetical protein
MAVGAEKGDCNVCSEKGEVCREGGSVWDGGVTNELDHLDEVARGQYVQGAEHLAHQPRHRRLARACRL